MPQAPMLAPVGLYTNANALGAVPAGALLRADNLEIGRDGVLDSIRGLEAHAVLFDQTFPGVSAHWQFYTATDVINRLCFWKQTLLAQRGAGKLSKATLASIAGSGTFWWSDFAGTYLPPDMSGVGATMRFTQVGGSLFFTTSLGVYKLDGLSGTPMPSGVPKAFDTVALPLTSGTAVPDQMNAAYRVCWVLRDSTGRLLFGAPSGRTVMSNTLGSIANGQVATVVPPGITSSHFLQLYRSAVVASNSEPSDELQLVYETTGGHVVGNTVTIVDIVPDSQRGANLYTNPSQQGLLLSNEPPPLARDVVRWRNNLFYFNTTTKRRRFLTLIGTGTGSLSVGDVLTLAGSTYTGITSTTTPGTTDGTFRVYTAGTVSQNLQLTMRDLVRAISARSGNTALSAFYASAVNEAPGKVLLEERGIGNLTDASFAMIASAHGSAWAPALPTSGATIFIPSERGAGRIYWSKDGEYEAVPIGNNVDVADSSVDGLRILPLRDSLIILKGDGAYRCTGRGAASFTFSELDVTALLIAPETAVVLSNQVFGLFEQGVCKLSDGSGLQVLSRPIEDSIVPLQILFPTQLPFAFGIAYEQARTYEIHIPATGVSAGMGRAFRYNLFTQAWMGVQRQCTAGMVGGSPGKLYYGLSNGWTLREKKTFTARDYQGSSFPFEIDSAAGNLVQVRLSADSTPLFFNMAFFAVGDYVVQGANVSQITAVNAGSFQLTVADVLTWTTGFAESVKQPVQEVCRFTPATLGDPSGLKQVQDVLFFFEGALPVALNATYDTPFISELTEPVDLSVQTTPGVASAPPPADAVSGPWLSVGFTHQVLFEKLSLLGCTVLMQPFSQRGGR